MRRDICLMPLTALDLDWYFEQFNHPEIVHMFGYDGPAKMKIMRQYRVGSLVVGTVHQMTIPKRIGFVIVFPPNDEANWWEYGCAVEPSSRNAFSAIHATDAMTHYMLDHLRVPILGFRILVENKPAQAIAQRLGYPPIDLSNAENGPSKYFFYRVDASAWAARKAHLQRNTQEYPFSAVR